MSRRESILENIASTLQGISLSGGYKTDIQQVIRQEYAPEDFPGISRMIGVVEQSFDFEDNEVKVFGANDYPATMKVKLAAMLRTTATDAEADKSGLIDDIQTALWQDRARGQTYGAVNTIGLGFTEVIELDGTGGAIAGIMAILTVTFLTNPASP